MGRVDKNHDLKNQSCRTLPLHRTQNLVAWKTSEKKTWNRTWCRPENRKSKMQRCAQTRSQKIGNQKELAGWKFTTKKIMPPKITHAKQNQNCHVVNFRNRPKNKQPTKIEDNYELQTENHTKKTWRVCHQQRSKNTKTLDRGQQNDFDPKSTNQTTTLEEGPPKILSPPKRETGSDPLWYHNKIFDVIKQ